jgi:uncharacterized membrane protein (UPF0127 family)
VNLDAIRARLESPSGSEWVRRAAWGVLALSLLVFVVRGGSQPTDPFLIGDGDRQPLPGFDEIGFTITDPQGAMAEWCAMLAASDAQHAQGLMNQRDLRGYDAMLFRYDEPINGAYWMKDTLIPLAVAYFDAGGRFINAQGMDPCPPDTVSCPTYPAAAPFQYAIEVPRGGLGALGIGAGSQLQLGGTPCP